MQTWAKRGMQAALVTGGMLAAGSGVASADTCPERSGSPLDGPAFAPPGIGDGTPRTSGRCFSGELFPEELADSIPAQADAERTLDRPVSIVGTLDPFRDVLPAIEDALTHELPRVTDEHWFQPPRWAGQARHSLELAGWVADTSQPDERAGHHVGPRIGTPAEGFHRSLSWTGPIGSVVDGIGLAGEGNGAAAADHEFQGAARSLVGPELVIPAEDPAVLEDFGRAGGIVQLWEDALGRVPGTATTFSGLVSPGTDLTEVRVDGLTPRIHDIPRELVGPAVAQGRVPQQAAKSEFVPLHVPGEYQERIDDVPDLSGVDVLTTVPAQGELDSFAAGRTSTPVFDRPVGASTRASVAQARELHETQILPKFPAFSKNPLRTDVAVTTVDELFAAMPERDRVTEIPLQGMRVPRTAGSDGVSLPVLGDGVSSDEPDLYALHGRAMANASGSQPTMTPALTKLDTATMLRTVSRRL